MKQIAAVFNTYRQKAGMFLLVFASTVSLVLFVVGQISFFYQNQNSDYVSIVGARYAPLNDSLPKDEVVGYFSDGYNDPVANMINASKYFTLQYWVAPTVVAKDMNHRIVIGNLFEVGKTERRNDLVIEKYFGKGLAIFRNESP